MRSVILCVCADRHTAEDVTQETFLAAYGSLGKLRDAQRFGGWLLTIARFQAGRYLRGNTSCLELVSEIEAVGDSEPVGLSRQARSISRRLSRSCRSTNESWWDYITSKGTRCKRFRRSRGVPWARLLNSFRALTSD